MAGVEHWEEILGIVFFFSHSSFLVEEGRLLAVGGVEWEGFHRITTPRFFLHHSALHTTLFVHTSDGTNTNDSDPHQALLNKLHRMQVPSPLICLFEGYLSQRLQRVTLNGQCSPGSWYCSLSRSAKLLMFADDVLMYKPITSHSDLIAFQIDVDTIGHWSLLNQPKH